MPAVGAAASPPGRPTMGASQAAATSHTKAARKSSSVSGRSSCARCPQPGSTARREPGRRSESAAAAAGVLMWSLSPVITSTGSPADATLPSSAPRSTQCSWFWVRQTCRAEQGRRAVQGHQLHRRPDALPPLSLFYLSSCGCSRPSAHQNDRPSTGRAAQLGLPCGRVPELVPDHELKS